MTIHLTNRLMTFIQGILLGQIQTKTLRLGLLDAQERARTTLMSTDIEELVNQVPDLLEIAASAIELGLGISDLSCYFGVVSFVVVIPAIGKKHKTIGSCILTLARCYHPVFKTV